jgi:6-phosphofructokinase 1
MVGIRDNAMELCPLEKAVKGKTKIDLDLLRVSDIMTT